MPLALKQAVFQHALDLAQVVKDNCVMKHGLPERYPRLLLGEETEPEQATADTRSSASVTVIDQPAQPAPATAGSKPIDWKKWAAIAALATGVGGLGIGGATYLLRPYQSTTVIEQGRESLLQYLEDKGLHLPPEKRSP